MQVAIYDNQVTTLGAHYQARAYDAKLLAPATRPVWGVEEVTATEDDPLVGSALVEWRYTDLPGEPVEALPPSSEDPAYEDQSLDPHECPRRQPEAQEQVRHFLETGEIIQTCDGVCESTKAAICP